ncbi:MAG: hypothetical protein KAY37_09615 [Phycisphaerae bacterium]|nr:hypothetical protein [Phycisphaerae bacterium]
MISSAWQNIPFCVDALLKIAPRNVLDVGVGFGRWGMIVREFCEVWLPATGRQNGRVHIEGIEAVAECITAHHKEFYDELHVAEAADVFDDLTGPWDLTIFGHVLEHMPRDVALKLLRAAVERSQYVLVNVTLGAVYPQPESPANPYERRESNWESADFSAFPVVRKAWFSDHAGRPLATFIISRNDTRDLRTRLFSANGDYLDQAVHEGMSYELNQVLDALGDLAAELQYIKRHSTYRLGKKLRGSGLWNMLRWLRNRNRRIAYVRAAATSRADSKGTEVWLVQASPNAGETPIPWDFIETDQGWYQQSQSLCPYGHCLVSQHGGVLRVPADRDPELRFMTHPYCGLVTIEYQGRRETIDLYSLEGGEVRVFPARTPMAVTAGPLAGEEWDEQDRGPAPSAARLSPTRSAADETFLRELAAAGARVVAVHCPRWIGVSNSTRTLFEHTYAVPESPTEEPYLFDDGRLDRYVNVLCESEVEHLVFSGGDEMHFELMQRLRKRKPNVRCDLLWHGGYLFFNKDYDWRVLRLWMDAAKEGAVATIGTVKKGMEEFFQSTGLHSKLVLNYIPGTPREPPVIAGDAWHVGFWMSDTIWKLPHAMLAALRMVPNVRLHAAGLSERAEEVAHYFNVPVELFHVGKLPRDKLHEKIRQTHLTMYVTFTECCPMLPLESVNLGVPCLIGPTSHLFEDNEYLFERLVVPFPERAEVIARYTKRALEERGEIMAACRRYIPEYNEAARRSIAEFLA